MNSRRNALVHGLCSSVVLPEDANTIARRAAAFFDTLRPQNDFHGWLVSEISLATWKIDHSERIDRRVRDKIAIRAESSWDDNKKLEAELLGEQLANRPAVVVDKLKTTPQGCEWMIRRWAMLAYCADCKHSWTPGQVQLAFDLLATPADFREGHNPGVAIDDEGRVIDPGSDPAAVARREIEALKARIELIAPLDEANRALAMADLNDDQDPELKRVRRYEATLHSRLRWCTAQLQKDAPTREVPRWLKDKWLGNQPEYDDLKKAKELAEAQAAQFAELDAARRAEAAQPPEPEVQETPVEEEVEAEPRPTSPLGQSPDFDPTAADRNPRKRKNLDDLLASRRRKVERRIRA